MTEWLTAREIAELELPSMPTSKQGVNRLAAVGGWKEARDWNGNMLCRARAGCTGGGLEYHVSLLPPAARVVVMASNLKSGPGLLPHGPTAIPVKTVDHALRRDARLAALSLADAHFANNRNFGRAAADHDFAARYNNGLIQVSDWLKSALKTLSEPSLKRWRRARNNGQWHTIGGTTQKGNSVLEAAHGGAVATRIGAFLLKQPFLSAIHVRDLIEAEFGSELQVGKRRVALPHERSFQRFIVSWRETNKVFITQFTNPDAFKSRHRLTGSNAYADVKRLNQRWEIDASPADVLLVGGRHSIYVLVDVFSRRVMVHVSKTPRTEASLLLLRKAILSWGVPEVLKTDNGSDFTSEAFVRALSAVGIVHDISAPFSPEQKAIVERTIGTMQHKFCTLLPGFIGHNVHDRSQIEARRAFAARLGDTDDHAFCVDIDLKAFQDYCDRWASHDYAHTRHRGIGMTPEEKARSCMEPVRKIQNERALDILLSPAAGGWRVVTKRGIQMDGDFYLAGELLPGQRVFCRQHPDDYGRLLCFNDEHGEYICEAICAERTGASYHEVFAETSATRQRVLKEGLKEAKAQARAIKPRHMVDAVLDLKRRKAIAAAGNVIAMPKRQELHLTPALQSAADAVAPRPSDELTSESVPTDTSTSNVVRLPETSKQRFKRALDLKAAIDAGADVDPAEAMWLGGYINQDEYKSMADMVSAFGSEWLEA